MKPTSRLRPSSPGQVLVLFVLFLLVLLGVSALAIDYASWLLTDRNLQNVSDHAALAGASEFDLRNQGNCTGSGAPKCVTAREQSWKSVINDLNLRDDANAVIGDAAIAALAADDSPAGGQPSGTYGGQSLTFADTIWVATPPPNYPAYTDAGGRYTFSYGVMFVRVDRAVRSFLGGAIGIKPAPRAGWATAGALPTDFALEVFCRNNVAPENGVCVNSAGLSIDGQGGIRLIRGDIGSNESLTVTSNVGSGVILQAGNVFLVNRSCAPSTWNCPAIPATTGGISDADPVANPTTANNKNAFYMAPLPVPQFANPVTGTDATYDCRNSNPTTLCVPYKDQASSSPNQPGDWTCLTSGSINRCGAPTVTTLGSSSTVQCVGQGGGNAPLHYYATSITSGASITNADAAHPQSPNSQNYLNIDDDFDLGDPDTTDPTPATPTDYLYTDNINITGSGGPQSTSFIVSLGQSGPRQAGVSTVTYVAFWTDEQTNGGLTSTGNPVTLQVSLLPGSGTTPIQSDPVTRTLTNTPQRFSFDVGNIPANQFNSLRLRFTFTSSGSTAAADERGGGISWAEIKHPEPQPPIPPAIPPGYYRSINIPDGGCAVLDPTAEYSALYAYQMPGIYRFGGNGAPNDRKIKLGDGSFLIGDGVTLVFDPDWPDSGSNQGIAIGANGALVLNTMRVPGTPPCTPSETEALTVNQSYPSLGSLQYSAVCAAWAVDVNLTSGIRPGQNAWAPCNTTGPTCLHRLTDYDPVPSYRGVTLFFTPSGWPPTGITNRFEMQGGSGNDAGLAFRGILYAPYDDVKITGGNGFNTIGQVLAWTAKFNGGSAYIDLDYPYDPSEAAPYLLEPTVGT